MDDIEDLRKERQLEMRDDIVSFMRNSALVAQSIEGLLPDLPRWEQRLLSIGITAVPRHPLLAKTPMEVAASNWLVLFIKQSMKDRDKSVEHEYRNFAGVRPYKP